MTQTRDFIPPIVSTEIYIVILEGVTTVNAPFRLELMGCEANETDIEEAIGKFHF